jgi:carboxyl-terminal processing protease
MHAAEVPPTPSTPALPPAPKRRRPGLRGPATGLLIAAVFVAGVGVGRFVPVANDVGSPAASPDAAAGPTGGAVDDFGLVREAWDLLHEKYVGRDTLDDRDLAYGAIDGLTEAVGDTGHTDFMTPEERASRNDALSGSYVGIGIQLDATDAGEPLIVTVFHDSPADKAGLRTGDIILEVNGVPAVDTSTSDVVERIRGEAGTEVELTVRAGENGPPRTLTIVRGEVAIDAVSSTIVPGTTTGLLRIEQFSNGAADDVRTALEQLRKDGADRLVLDVRGNPGGYVGEAVGIASQFLGSGTVYVERDAAGKEKATPVSPDGAWTDLPLIVLVD